MYHNALRTYVSLTSDPGDDYERSLKVPFVAAPDPGLCADQHDQCEQWASSGECERNPVYMVTGGSVGQGACRAACKACLPCRDAMDEACIAANRERGGYLNVPKSEFRLLYPQDGVTL